MKSQANNIDVYSCFFPQFIYFVSIALHVGLCRFRLTWPFMFLYALFTLLFEEVTPNPC